MAGTVPNTPPTQIVVLSGPAGSGKTTVVNRLIEQAPVKLVKAVSATTRPARKGEVDGEDYYFLSYEQFQRRKDNGEFLETAEVHASGYWYGTLHSEIQRAAEAGGWAFLEIDVQGALKVIEEYPDAVTIFLTTPSEADYEQRLRARGTESEAAIRRRLETARRELKHADKYRYQVVNDDLEQTVQDICDLMAQEQQGE